MSRKRAAILSVKSVSALSQVASPPFIRPPKQFIPAQWSAIRLSGSAAEKSDFQADNSSFQQHNPGGFEGGADRGDPRMRAGSNGAQGGGQYGPHVGMNSDGFHGRSQFDSRLQTSPNGYGREVSRSYNGFDPANSQQGFQSWRNGVTPQGGLNPTWYDPRLQSPNGYGGEPAQQSRSGFNAERQRQEYQNCYNGGVITAEGNWNSTGNNPYPDGFRREVSHQSRSVVYAESSGQGFQNCSNGLYVQNDGRVASQVGLNRTGFYGPPKPSSSMQSPNFDSGGAPVEHNGTFHMGGSQHMSAQFSSSGANFHQNSHRPQSPNVAYNESGVGLRGDNLNVFSNRNGLQREIVGTPFLDSAKPEGPVVGQEEGNKFKGTVEELDEFCKEGKVQEAVEVLNILEKQGTLIELPRYFQLMQACGDAESLNEAKAVHDHIMRSLGKLEVRVYNKILEMFAKCGSMDDAIQVFEKMPQRNLTTWDTLITGYVNNGLGEEAIDAFTRFKQQGLNPDGQLFLGLFSACSILNAVDEGMLHFESMVKDYGIAPTMAHYVAMVELLGKSGHLDEAMEFIEKMPMEPTVDVWEALMNLSRVYGNMELGERCAKIVECLDASRLTEQSKAGLVPVEASFVPKVKEKKLSAGTRIYQYRAGDTSHPETGRIYENLKFLSAQMREAGYVPDTTCVLHDVDPESKEEALLSHSEKLALSYGLISSPVNSPIRIIKNLRTCKDCHNALKIASKLVGREILNRDAKRFHRFQDGVCSCKDYW